MPRPRPEEPIDSAAAGADPAEESKRDADRRHADRRKRRREEAEESAAEDRAAAADKTERPDEAEAEAASAPDLERRREVAAEAAFHERVALRELANRLPPETYRAIERFLAGTPAEWRLEKGRYLFTYLVGERELTVDDRPVRVEHKLAIVRDEPPAEPAALDRRIVEAVKPDAPVAATVQNLEALRTELELAPGDEVRIRLAPEQPEIVVTAEEVTVAEPPTAPEATVGPEPEASEAIVVTPERVAAIVAEVEREVKEDLDVPVEGASPSVRRLPTRQEAPSVDLSVGEGPSLERAPETVTNFGDVLAVLDREAVNLNDLPPIAGGATEESEPARPQSNHSKNSAERPQSEAPKTEPEPPPEPPEPPPADRPEFPPGPPAPRHRHRRPHRRHPGREILHWEPGWAEAVRRPDHEMRKRGRKLLRRLAAEYGIKLTPDLEAYLLSILLRPRRINGRLVYGLGLNVAHLISVLQILKYNFNFTRRRPAG